MNDILSIIYPNFTTSTFCKILQPQKTRKNAGILENLVKFGDKKIQQISGKAEEMMIYAIKYGKYKIVKYLLNKFEKSFCDYISFTTVAVSATRKRISKLLFGKIVTLYDFVELLESAALNDNLYIFRKVHTKVGNEINMNTWHYLLSRAVEENCANVVNYIITMMPIGNYDMSDIMSKAGEKGNMVIIQILMKREDCVRHIFTLLRGAIENNRYFVVRDFIKFNDQDPKILFWLALDSKNLLMIKLIIEYTNIDYTGLHHGLRHDIYYYLDSIPILEYLLKNPKTRKSIDIESAKRVAEKHKNQKILDLLKNEN